MRALGALACAALSCSAPALQPELAQAEEHERAGRNDAALGAYTRAQGTCTRTENLRLRYQRCREAYLGRAELLDRMGKRRQAAEEYKRVPALLSDHDAASAEAIYRAGRIYLELGDDKQAYTLLWRVVTDYPDEEFAADSLKLVVRDGRKRNPKQLQAELVKLSRGLPDKAIADNLLYQLANLAENEMNDPTLAVSYLDLLAERYPKGGLVDDALWHAARLSRKLGDGQGAATRLRKLQSTREVAFGTGSYLSVWHDNGQLELGLVLRDDIGDHAGAARELRKLHTLYPDSILRDDALFEEAVSWAGHSARDKACAALGTLLKKHPESKYELEKAPALRAKLSCPAPSTAKAR